MVIRPLDHVANCYTWDSGAVISRLIRNAFARGDTVTITFSGITDVPSSFVNAAFVSLLGDYSFDFIKAHLKITNASRQIVGMISHRFAFVTTQAAA